MKQTAESASRGGPHCTSSGSSDRASSRSPQAFSDDAARRSSRTYGGKASIASDAALLDLKESLSRWQYAASLGWEDLKLRYRRSTLGPLWLTVGMAMLAVALSVVWSTLFQMELKDIFAYLTAGLIVWQYVSGNLTESCNTFVAQAEIIRSVRVPLTLHAIRLCVAQFLAFAHGLPVYAAVAAIFGVPLTWSTLALVPGLALLFLNSVWLSVFMGMVGARYRDVAPILGSIMPMIFLVSPIVWKVEMLGTRGEIATLNPITHFLAVVREPMLGQLPQTSSYCVVLSVTVLGLVAAFSVFRRYRTRIVYWV
jgi:ABC-2 type transport system permease protein